MWCGRICEDHIITATACRGRSSSPIGGVAISSRRRTRTSNDPCPAKTDEDLQREDSLPAIQSGRMVLRGEISWQRIVLVWMKNLPAQFCMVENLDVCRCSFNGGNGRIVFSSLSIPYNLGYVLLFLFYRSYVVRRSTEAPYCFHQTFHRGTILLSWTAPHITWTKTRHRRCFRGPRRGKDA